MDLIYRDEAHGCFACSMRTQSPTFTMCITCAEIDLTSVPYDERQDLFINHVVAALEAQVTLLRKKQNEFKITNQIHDRGFHN